MVCKTIAISEELKEGLDNVKLCPSETYDHVVSRLLKEKNKEIAESNKY